jgi:rhomboid protease GluP
MTEAAAEPPREISYPISYQNLGGGAHSLDFKGSGTLTIRPEGPTYVFRGKARKLFAGPPRDLELGPDNIWNVVVSGRAITFRTNQGEAGGRKQPFVFYCKDAAEAKGVAALLPVRLDDEFTAARDFFVRLNALTDARGPWSSVTNLIIALNVAVFVIMGCLGAGWFGVDSMTPYILYGANNGGATTDGEWWRLLTSMFMHFGAIHLLLNMWALFQAGHFLEKLLGRSLYALTYLGSGLAGGLLSIAWHGDKVWSAGASGAIFGVYGAIVGYLWREKQAVPSGIYGPMMKSTLTFGAYNIVYGMRAGVDNSAHLGGVIAGLALGWLLALPVDREVRRQKAGRNLGLGLVAVAVMLTVGVLATPRFDYNLRDELTWEEALKGFGDKETELLQRHQKTMAEIGNGADGAAHARWMATELVPFYQGWDRTITSLQLKPGRLTARRRDGLDRIFKMRVEAYQHLIAGLQGHEAEAVSQYYREETKVGAEIEKMQKP